MENPLNELVSGTTKRPIIVNGQLLMEKGQMVRVKRERYRIEYTRLDNNRQEVVIEDGQALLDKAADDFNSRFGSVVDKATLSTATDFSAEVDKFTGALVLHNAVYDTLCDRDNSKRFHDQNMQFPPDTQRVLQDFLGYSVGSFFNIYMRLMTRRLMASSMPMMIRGHLVAGLHQPLVVSTTLLECPLRMREFEWFFTYLNSPEQIEKYLERRTDTPRDLELTVVSMYDFCTKMGIPLVRELNRLNWTFVLYIMLLSNVAPGKEDMVINQAPHLWNAIDEGRGANGIAREFAIQLSQALRSLRGGLALR